MRPPVPPPFEVQQRAWECAYMLREEFADRLSLEHRIYVEVVYRTPADGLGWHECARMFVLYGQHVEVRV